VGKIADEKAVCRSAFL